MVTYHNSMTHIKFHYRNSNIIMQNTREQHMKYFSILLKIEQENQSIILVVSHDKQLMVNKIKFSIKLIG